MRAIISAAGEARRWNNHGGVPKHLTKIRGERLLDRTVRLLRENGVTDICLTIPKNDPRYHIDGVELWPKSIDPHYREGDRFLPSEAWSTTERTIIMPGDAYFTSAYMKAIIEDDRDDWFFGLRLERYLWRGWLRSRAVFATSFPARQFELVKDAIESLTAAERDPKSPVRRSLGLDLYRWMNGEAPEDVGKTTATMGIVMHRYPVHLLEQPRDDATTDFDRPRDKAAFRERYNPETDV